MKKLLFIGLATLLLVAGCTTTTKKITGKINIYTRDSTSGTREAYEGFIGYKGKLAATAIEVTSNGDMAAKVGADVNGIGYVSLTTDFAANNLIALTYEGVAATIATTLDGTYKLQRPFNLVTRAAGDFGSADKEQLVMAFVDFLQNSIEGHEAVKAAGGIVDATKGVAWSTLKTKYPVVSKDNTALTIYTAGSTSVDKTLKAALEAFQPMAGNFKINMNQTGSGDGHKRVLGSEKDGANKADIGFASRNFSATEDVTKAAKSGTYCIDAVVTVVNKKNANITNLTKDQTFSIYTGALANWEDIK